MDITIQKESIDDKKIVEDTHVINNNQLLREIEILKNMILDLNTKLSEQNDVMEKLDDSTIVIIDKVVSINNELETMKDERISQSRFTYIKDYILPTIGLAVLNTPIFWLMGPKAGLMSSAIYLMYKKI